MTDAHEDQAGQFEDEPLNDPRPVEDLTPAAWPEPPPTDPLRAMASKYAQAKQAKLNALYGTPRQAAPDMPSTPVEALTPGAGYSREPAHTTDPLRRLYQAAMGW